MPNWTKNEVTFTSVKTTNIKKIKEIFKKGSPSRDINFPNFKKYNIFPKIDFILPDKETNLIFP